MASEITYAEVKFKNASPAAMVKVPPETKKHEHHPQKCPPWLPWLISLLFLLVCIALVIALFAGGVLVGSCGMLAAEMPLPFAWRMAVITCETERDSRKRVAPCSPSSGQPTILQQRFMEWRCFSVVLQGKGRGWTCCPKAWKHFHKSCYYLSDDMMPLAESVKNCTEMGSHLVVINSEAEQAFLTQALQQSPKGTNYYIGLSAQEVSQWQWVDRTPYNESATFWRTGEPSNVIPEMCVVIHSNSQINNWNDVRCDRHYRICEAAAVTV
ncbi:C-type lectin domain family 4 member E-like isoform 1-T1 [Chlamydotis macqueenii]